MKKLLIVVIIITLPLITFFQYKNYRRFHPPVNYEYAISGSIDVHYHDAALVEEYYAKSVEVGAYARNKWSNEGIDVRFPDENSETEVTVSIYYQHLLTRLHYLESALTKSAELKSSGYSNSDIKKIEAGEPIIKVMYPELAEGLKNIELGETGEHIWMLQKRLTFQGLDLPVDGVFGEATKTALMLFQQSNDLYPSGQVSKRAFESLFVDKK